MINGPSFLHYFALCAAIVGLIYAHQGLDDLRKIRRTLQVFVALFIVLTMTGCADVKIVVPTKQADGTLVYPSTKIIDCLPDPANRYPCRPPTDDEVVAFAKVHDKEVADTTVTIPVGKCVAADISSTVIGLSTGRFHEAGIAFPVKLVITAWQVQYAKSEAAKGNALPAKIACATHAAGAAWNVAHLVGAIK